MEDSFVAVRRISHGLDRGGTYHSSSGSGAWLGRGLACVCAQKREHHSRYSFDLTPAQEDCLQRLQSRVYVPYDGSNRQHQEALRALWKLAYPEEQLHGMISEQWKGMGWQGKDPSTDFRGGGFISLENLLYFARNFQKSFQQLLRKQVGDRSVWEYPFAVAGVNMTFMLIQMLETFIPICFFSLQLASSFIVWMSKCFFLTVKPRNMVRETFLKLLAENESALDILYCTAFKLMDDKWLSMRASYMDFNTVMKSTRHQLERELLLEDVTRVQDLPSFNLLSP